MLSPRRLAEIMADLRPSIVKIVRIHACPGRSRAHRRRLVRALRCGTTTWVATMPTIRASWRARPAPPAAATNAGIPLVSQSVLLRERQ
jgi:hypothetical protein